MWNPLGSGVSSDGVFALTVFNGELSVGGAFYLAGGQISSHWARWSTSASSPPDLDCDGVVGGFDLALLLGQWTGTASYMPCPPTAAADLNGDCRINGFDLALVLAAWG